MPSSRPRPLPHAERLGFSSLAVHAGERLPAFDTKPVATPIYSSVAFEAPSAEALDAVFDGTQPGYCYTRHGNPTLEALEETITRLERGAGGDRVLVRHGRHSRGVAGGRRSRAATGWSRAATSTAPRRRSSAT